MNEKSDGKCISSLNEHSRERERKRHLFLGEKMAKNAISPLEQIMVQLSEGGEGFGVRNERDDASGGR